MGGRIRTMQRQARELGRLRTGWSVPNADPDKRARPVKSKTWVLTSYAENYIAAAVEAWGGKIERWQPQGNGAPQFRVITEAERLDAVLPQGDPLNQFNEMWNAGGCVRRCNGEFEQISRKPCVCLATCGEEWYLRPKGTVCATTSRLNVILPDMPDVGLWRAETHSFYAAKEMAGTIDMVQAGSNGEGWVPVTLRIQPRTRVAGGQTKRFPVVVVEIRGITLRQALAGPISTAVALDPTAPRLAIEAAVPDYEAQARMCRTPDDVKVLWQQIRSTDLARATDELLRRLQAIAEDIGRGIEPMAPDLEDDEDEAIDAELVDPDDPDDLWARFEAAGLALGWNREETERGFADSHKGLKARAATAQQVRAYIAKLHDRRSRQDA
jgi:hypothetical protein